MCVAITLMAQAELSLEEITNMQLTNRDGVGFAWADGELVHWVKAVDTTPERIKKFVDYYRDHPRLLHFRLSTAGGIQAGLCHPFEIGPKAAFAPEGSGNKVMIHNGHWGGWHDLKMLMDREKMLPEGPWSDTRLIAFLAHEDEEWLETLGGRVATMDAVGNIKYLGDWYDLREGVRVSNKHWQNPPKRVYEAPKEDKKEGKENEKAGRNGGQGYYGSGSSAYRSLTFTHRGETIHCWTSGKRTEWNFWNPGSKKMDKVTAEDPVDAIKEAIGRATSKAKREHRVESGPVCDYVKVRDCGLLTSELHDEPCSRCPYKGA